MPKTFKNVIIWPYDVEDIEAQVTVAQMKPGTLFFYKIEKNNIFLYDIVNEEKGLAICDPEIAPEIISEIIKGQFYTVYKTKNVKDEGEISINSHPAYVNIFVTFKPVDKSEAVVKHKKKVEDKVI